MYKRDIFKEQESEKESKGTERQGESIEDSLYDFTEHIERKHKILI